jgi:hypothetical protein
MDAAGFCLLPNVRIQGEKTTRFIQHLARMQDAPTGANLSIKKNVRGSFPGR